MKRSTGARALAVGLFTALAVGSCGAPAQVTAQQQAEVVTAFQQSLEVRGAAARNFDTSRFADYFADDAAVPLSDGQKDALQRMAPGTPPTGYLTYMRAYYADWKTGAEAYARLEAAVKAGQRPNPSDAAIAVAPRDDPIRIPALTVKRFTVQSADRAYVEVDGEGIIYKVTLVRRSGRWLIAGEQRSVTSNN